MDSWMLRPGTDFVYDGEACTVAEVADGAVILRDRTGRHRRVRMIDVLRPAAEGGKAHIPGRVREEGATPLGVLWADATDSARARTMERADHVREVLTGYKSGSAQIAREGEPRLEYHPQRSLRQRTAAKATELGKGERTVRRWVAQYRESGEAGLVDYRSSKSGNALTGFDPRWVATALVMSSPTPLSLSTPSGARS